MSELEYEKSGHRATFTFNRPAQRNALNMRTWRLLEEAVLDFDDDPDMRVGIVTGSGDTFCAGRDLTELAAMAASGQEAPVVPAELREVFSRSPKPFVAAVNGPAVGGGFERAIDCDFRVAASGAWFSLPEPRHGLVAAYAVHHLVRIVPFGEAMRLLLTGNRITAAEALRIGLVQEVTDAGTLLARAEELADQVASAAPQAIALTKRLAMVWRWVGLERSHALLAEGEPALDADRRAGLAAWAGRPR